MIYRILLAVMILSLFFKGEYPYQTINNKVYSLFHLRQFCCRKRSTNRQSPLSYLTNKSNITPDGVIRDFSDSSVCTNVHVPAQISIFFVSFFSSLCGLLFTGKIAFSVTSRRRLISGGI